MPAATFELSRRFSASALGAVFAAVSLSCWAAFVGIHAAAAKGDVAELKRYLQADPGLLSSRNGAGRTPLCVAAMCGQKDAVEFLLSQKADVNDRGFQQMTPLADMTASWGLRDDARCAEIAALLLTNHAAVDPVDEYGQTPLMWAAETGKPKLAQVLLEQGANIAAHCQIGRLRGQTPLHFAVASGHRETVEVLLKFNPPLDAADHDGATPLDLAEGKAQPEIADLLRAAMLARGQQPPERPMTPPAKEAMRALAIRIANGDPKALDELAKTAEEMYRGIKDPQKQHARIMLNLWRMQAAFDLLGEEAGKGNSHAFDALTKSLSIQRLDSFAPDALGLAAAAGNRPALEILLHYRDLGILESTAHFALCVPARANVEPAVEYLVNWLNNESPFERGGGLELDATNALASAAAKGNQNAKAALERLTAGAPQQR